MQDYRDKIASAIQQIDADTPRLSICDSLEKISLRFVEKMLEKAEQRNKDIEKFEETVRANDAAIAEYRRKAIELKNKCTLQEEKNETQRANQKSVIDKVNKMYAITKLMKSHCSIQKKLSKDREEMHPRVEHYVSSVERMVADAGRKMALQRRQLEQELAIVKQQIKENTEKRDNMQKKHLEMQTEVAWTGLESNAAIQVMKTKLDETLAAEAQVKQEIERRLKEEKEIEQRVILFRQKVKKEQRAYAEGKNKMVKDISDLETRHLENEQEERSLQEELVTEENVTKQVGEESSGLQERLLTMEDSIAVERKALEDVTEQLEGLKKEHDVVMATQTVLTQERDSKQQRLQEIEEELKGKSEEWKQRSELVSAKYWQDLDEKAEWTRREEELAGRAEALRGRIDASRAISEEIQQRRAEKMALVQSEEELKSIRESVKGPMTEELKSKRTELECLNEATEELRRKLESVSSGNANMRSSNEKDAAELAVLKTDCRQREKQLEVTRKRKNELVKMEEILTQEVASVQEHAAKLTKEFNTRILDLAKMKEITDKEEQVLLQSIEKKKTKVSALRERNERIQSSDITSALTDKQRSKLRENAKEVEVMQRKIDQHRLLLAGKRKYQNELMSSLQKVAGNRAKIAMSVATHGNDIKLLRRKLKKGKPNPSVEGNTQPGAMPPPSAPAALANTSGHHVAQRKYPNIKPESDLDFDFSDF